MLWQRWSMEMVEEQAMWDVHRAETVARADPVPPVAKDASPFLPGIVLHALSDWCMKQFVVRTRVINPNGNQSRTLPSLSIHRVRSATLVSCGTMRTTLLIRTARNISGRLSPRGPLQRTR